MPGKCVFVDGIEFEPIEGENLHFTILTGSERLQFCITRASAIRTAYAAIATVAEANSGAVVVPFCGALTG